MQTLCKTPRNGIQKRKLHSQVGFTLESQGMPGLRIMEPTEKIHFTQEMQREAPLSPQTQRAHCTKFNLQS